MKIEDENFDLDMDLKKMMQAATDIQRPALLDCLLIDYSDSSTVTANVVTVTNLEDNSDANS
ncbi:hypothetical protein VA599_18675 [Chromobacterium sp. TRC.1.1.SA]|uniref:Uncharacterized protein n=1 Tax=Chromobacterium indicum TaxID=3110228 RepID=A0ABV0CS23_9NEIS